MASLTTNPLAELEAARERTLALVAHLTDAELEQQVTPLLSPLVWDLAHIAAYEDLWLVHRHGGRPLLRPDLAATYDALETPRPARGRVELLDAPGARGFLDDVRERTREVLAERGPDPLLHDLVLRHELQHTETMRQALRLGGREAPGDAALPDAMDGEDGWTALDGGRVAIGAAGEGFAYDNERPRHEVGLAPFRIARRPVTNATWLRFVEGGGLVRREWWDDEAWAWKEEHDITDHARARTAHPSAPLCHVSFHEAQALARSLGARLPTEAEWEHAATSGVLEHTGRVWEWTASPFRGYPGFRAHPYREYSEVFFDGPWRVLRGGSWATDPLVATPTCRNWDLPERRQLFAGVRLAC